MEKKLNQTQQSVVEVDGVSDVRDGKQLRNPIKPPCPPDDEAKLMPRIRNAELNTFAPRVFLYLSLRMMLLCCFEDSECLEK